MTTEQSIDEVQDHPATGARVGPWSRFAAWASQDNIEDFSLRYAPKSFRKWSPMACAVAALGGIAYLADYSIGASIAVTHGAANAVVASLRSPSSHRGSCGLPRVLELGGQWR